MFVYTTNKIKIYICLIVFFGTFSKQCTRQRKYVSDASPFPMLGSRHIAASSNISISVNLGIVEEVDGRADFYFGFGIVVK